MAPITLGLNLAMLALLVLLRGTDSEALGLLFGLVHLAAVTAAVIGCVSVQVGLYYDIPRVREARTEWAPRRRYYMPLTLVCMPLAGTYYVAKRRYLARQSPLDTDSDEESRPSA